MEALAAAPPGWAPTPGHRGAGCSAPRRGRPSAQKSAPCVARQNARGPGSGTGRRRMAGADSRLSPPGHRHVATVDGVESPVRPTPIEAIGAARADRHRLGGDAFAAPLPVVRLRKMGGFIRADGRFRRVSGAEALLLSELAPESAGGAIRRPDRLVTHRLLPWRSGFTALKLTDFVPGASFLRANLRDDLDLSFPGTPSRVGVNVPQSAAGSFNSSRAEFQASARPGSGR